MLPRGQVFAAFALVLLLAIGGWLLRRTTSGAPFASSYAGRVAPGSYSGPEAQISPETSPQGSALGKVEVGEDVFVISLDSRAVVTDAVPDSRGEVEVEADSVKTRVPLSDLRRVGVDTGGDTLPDILEPEGAQLTDIMDQVKTSCTQARPSLGAKLAIGLVTRCVEDAEGAMNLVDLLRGTVDGPAGARMPGEVRKRWQGTLASSTGTIRERLTPIWDAVGRTLAAGGRSPEEFRTLGHLRDRIGRVLNAAGSP